MSRLCDLVETKFLSAAEESVESAVIMIRRKKEGRL